MFHQWRDLAWPDFGAIDFERAVAVMPVAAHEQHGPHLPVSVDSDLNEGILRHGIAFIPDDVDVYALPQLSIGKSNEHLAYPGTLTLSATTLMSLWIDVAESVARAGFRKLLILNSHGGQPQVAEMVIREMRVRRNMLAVLANTYSLDRPKGLFPAEEMQFGIHGGAIETSMMLYLRPDAVRRDKITNFPSAGVAVQRDNEVLQLEGGINIGWMTQDVNPDGAIGDATLASAEHGETLVTAAAKRLGVLLGEISRYPLSALNSR